MQDTSHHLQKRISSDNIFPPIGSLKCKSFVFIFGFHEVNITAETLLSVIQIQCDTNGN